MGTSNVADKVVVITGGSSGLGESTAKLLSRQGAKVVLGARRKDRIDAVVKEISEAGGMILDKIEGVLLELMEMPVIKISSLMIDKAIKSCQVGHPRDIANAVMFLVTTPFATGSTVRVDGGGAIA